MAQFKEKIKHFLHHDKADKETTPGASPGYADVQTVPTNTTTNVPEAFYPGSRAVTPQEMHPTAPYTGALGTSMPGAPTGAAPAVPKDSAAMLGVPPIGGHMTSTQPEEATPTPNPSEADTGTGDHSGQTPETGDDTATPMGPEDLDEDLPIVPVSDVKTIDSPVTKSDLQAKNYPEEGPQDDVQERDLRGPDPEGQPKDFPASVSNVEPTEGKPEDEATDKIPEESNLEDNSSYSPMEENTETKPPATDRASDMLNEGGAPHDGFQT